MTKSASDQATLDPSEKVGEGAWTGFEKSIEPSNACRHVQAVAASDSSSEAVEAFDDGWRLKIRDMNGKVGCPDRPVTDELQDVFVTSAPPDGQEASTCWRDCRPGGSSGHPVLAERVCRCHAAGSTLAGAVRLPL